MKDPLDLEALARGILSIINEYELPLEYIGVTLTMPAHSFDEMAKAHPDLVLPYIVRKAGMSGSCQWYVQIQRRPTVEDFPPGAIVPPPIET